MIRALLAAWVISSICTRAAPLSKSNEYLNQVAAIRAHRVQVEHYVKLFKQRIDQKSPQYATAFGRYTEAYAANQSYMHLLTTSITARPVPQLLTESALQTDRACEEFVQYARDVLQTGQRSWASMAVILINLARDILESTKRRSRRERSEIADALQGEIQWRRWDEVR